jgi:predicted amino acid racemase
MPGTTSVEGIELLASAGATQVEPGHGLTGTTPLSAVSETIERPAIAYVTEVMHHHQGRAFVLGGGLYMDPVLGDIPTKAAVLTSSGDFEILEADTWRLMMKTIDRSSSEMIVVIQSVNLRRQMTWSRMMNSR